jgi:hypothetical protein
MKSTLLLAIFSIATTLDANASTVVSLSGPDGGGEPVSTLQFVSFRWVSDDSHFDVSVFAKLAAVSESVPFVGTADITSGSCCTPASSSEFAHSEFTVTSTNASFIELFRGLTLPPNNYYLTLAGTGPGAGLWVIAAPIAFLMTGPDSALAGGDLVAQGQGVDPLFPPGSQFISNGQQTQFAVIDAVAEPSSFVPLVGFMMLLAFRSRMVWRLGS